MKILQKNNQDVEKRERYNLNGFGIFIKVYIYKIQDQFVLNDVSRYGVRLSNNLETETKEAKSIIVFKKNVKVVMIVKYKE